MLVPPVSTWVTLWSLLAHHASAWNSTLTASDLPEDYTIEKSVQLAHLEGSGFDVITDNYSTMFTSLSYAESVRSNIKKRAADFYNGLVGPEFYSPFTIKAPRFPPNAVIGLSRPLQRGLRPPQVHYVAIWIPYPFLFMYPTNRAPRWGSIYFDQRMNVEGTFIQNGRIMNLTQPSMSREAVRLLQYVGTPESNNFKFVWVLARNLDVATAISLKVKSSSCSPRLAPAVFQDEGYEFLGEADIDDRTMQYAFQGHVYTVAKSDFLAKVYVLTKQRCHCSCAGGAVQS